MDYEARQQYSIRVRTTDQTGLSYEKVFEVTVRDVSEPPTEIYLSSNVISQDEVDSVVGILSAEDPDFEENFTFSLVGGESDTHNGYFQIVGDQLQIKISLDSAYEFYEIRVEVRDSEGLTYSEPFMIVFSDFQILLSGQEIQEGSPIGTIIGVLSVSDQTENAFQFSFSQTFGDNDNELFEIENNNLKIF